MSFSHRSPIHRIREYAIAAAAVGGAYVVTVLDRGLEEHAPLLLMIAAVVLASSRAGAGPGIFAAVLGTAGTASILGLSPAFPSRADVAAVTLFAGVSTMLAWVVANGRRSLAALEDSERRYRKLVDLLPDAVLVNRDQRWAFANRAAMDLLGAQRVEQVIGRSIFDCVPPQDRERVEQRERQARDGETTPLRQAPLLRLDGSLRHAEVTATRLADSGGDIVVVMRDVTERVHAEHERVRSAATLQAVIDASPIAVITLDRDAIVRTWNKAATATFGWTASEAIGRRYALADADDDSFTSSFAKALQGRATTLNATRRRKDGTGLDVMIATAPIIDDDGRMERVVALMMDMTEQRQLEAQFRQAQKLEAVGRLAGGVAHDFNNLLTAILGFSELALDGLPADCASRNDIREITRAGETAKALTGQLLAFSRKQIMRPTLLDLRTHVQKDERFLGRVIGEDVKIVLDLAPEPAVVRADPAQLDQVIMNLAVNARDAMPDGGELRLSVRPVRLDRGHMYHNVELAPGDYVMLSISDTGQGMTPEVQQRLFEPFYTTKTQGKGTGLGLATVYGIVKQSSGYIWVYSELGKGTTVKVYLPAVADAVPSALGVESRRSAPGSETVLIVDDSSVIANLAKRMLVNQGYTALIAESPAAAVTLAEQYDGPLDVVLTDVVMPDMSGTELARALRIRRPAIRVVYMSGYADGDVLRHALADPDAALIEKPFTAAKLTARIRELLQARTT